MEGGDPHRTSSLTNKFDDTRTHLVGRLIREGNGQDLVRPSIGGRQKMSDAPGEHSGLAGARTSDDQKWRPPVANGPGLRFSETFTEFIGFITPTRGGLGGL